MKTMLSAALAALLFIEPAGASAAEGIKPAGRTGDKMNTAQRTGKKVYPQVVLEDVEKICYRVDQAAWKAYRQPRGPVCIRLACLKAKGIEDFDYDDLQAVWGWGAVFAYHRKKYWVMYRNPPGFEGRLGRATGSRWEMSWPKSADKAWAILTKAIDAGKPLEGTYWEALLFVGYANAAKKANRRVYVLRDPASEGKGQWWSWEQLGKWAERNGLACETRKVRKASARNVAVDLMKTAVQCAAKDPRARDKVFAGAKLGLAGMAAYAADIADTSKKPDDFYAGWLGCHCANRQSNARKSMAVYLRRAAEHFDRKASPHILAAAKEYEAAYAAWGEYTQHLSGKDLAATKTQWTQPANRAAGAAAVRTAAEHEAAAIGALQRALASST